jgi:hypothetical protein
MKKLDALIIAAFTIFLLGSIEPFDYADLIVPPIGPSPLKYDYEEPIDPLPLLRDIPQEYEAIVNNAVSEAGVPIEIVVAIIWVESEFNPNALSPEREDTNRDMGICQFNLKYLQWYADMYNRGKEFDPMNPAEAIPVMALHIKWLHERYNHWPDVIMAYNAGFARVDSGNIPDCTWEYLFKIYSKEEL